MGRICGDSCNPTPFRNSVWRARQLKRARSAAAPRLTLLRYLPAGPEKKSPRPLMRRRARHFHYFPPARVSIEIEGSPCLAAAMTPVALQGKRTPSPSRDTAPRTSRRQAIIAAENAGPSVGWPSFFFLPNSCFSCPSVRRQGIQVLVARAGPRYLARKQRKRSILPSTSPERSEKSPHVGRRIPKHQAYAATRHTQCLPAAG